MTRVTVRVTDDPALEEILREVAAEFVDMPNTPETRVALHAAIVRRLQGTHEAPQYTLTVLQEDE